MKRKIVQIISLVLVIVMTLTGCGGKEEDTKVVLTTGFGQDEVFRIEKISAGLPELRVYLTNIQNQYEAVFGKEIWERKIEGVSLEDNIKDTVLARMAQIKVMNLLAESTGVSLTAEEIAMVEKTADIYYKSLNQTEIDKMDISVDTIIHLYSEYAIANKVYSYIIKDINPEISDDEARTITVSYILLKTYTLNGLGEKVKYSDKMKEETYKRAEMIAQKLNEGQSFESLMEEYSEAAATTYSFGKGDTDIAFEEAAFQLGTDEISDIVETEYGFYIIKCISTFDRQETDANKIKIVEQRKKEVFNEKYEEFVNSLTKNMNYELWEKVTFIQDKEVVTKDFFKVFDEYFKVKE